MKMREAYVCGIDYQLGEQSHDYLEASGFQEVVQANKLPDMPDLWGWGSFHVTKDAYDLGRQAAQKTLSRSRVDPAKIKLTVVACSYFPDVDDLLYQGTGRLLKALGLANSLLEGHTLMGCATLLSAVQNAAALVRAGLHENILVIGLDKMPQGYPRFWDYGLFSDAAASCVVSSSPNGRCLRMVGSARALELEEVIGGVRFNATNALHVRVLGDALGSAGWGIPQVNRVFNNNVYLPIKSQKDQLAGFKRSQMYLDNVRRTGHCLASDSLINFRDYSDGRTVASGERFVFQADGNGCCAVSLMQSEGK
jgi:3-oxoacyl-[acyl-carrier-protein] synthase III